MDEHIFDAVVRSLGDEASRRRLMRLLGGSLAGGTLVTLAVEDAEGKKKKGKKKKPCAPCRVRRKGKCKSVAPDGTACGNGGACKSGQCVVPKTCSPACVLPETCVNGACSCPTAQTCGETCCFETPGCEAGYCQCDGGPCSCPAGEALCVANIFTQCCLDGDTCDPVNACITDTCSAGNTFCTPEWALCNGSDECSCVPTRPGGVACANVIGLLACPDTSECASDAECGAGQVCVDPCCPEGEIRGLCVAVCPVGRSAASRAGGPGGSSGKQRVFGSR